MKAFHYKWAGRRNKITPCYWGGRGSQATHCYWGSQRSKESHYEWAGQRVKITLVLMDRPVGPSNPLLLGGPER